MLIYSVTNPIVMLGNACVQKYIYSALGFAPAARPYDELLAPPNEVRFNSNS